MATARKTAAAKPAVKSRGRVAVAEAPTGRRKVVVEESGQAASTYFANVASKDGLEFVSSGSAVLDAALGGGWCLGRVANIVGDRSAGKTLLAIEACANFHRQYPDGYIRYNEAEAAFDEAYAEALGMPIAAVDFKGAAVDPKDEEKYAELAAIVADRGADDRDRTRAETAMKKLKNRGVGQASNTVEALHIDIVRVLDQNPGKPILYIIDSLDALSDDAEQERAIGDASYGGSKPKKMGEMFRRLVDRMEGQRMLLIVVSQLRDKLNVTFGEKQTRSGGRALDFYASHIIWLAETGKLKKVIKGNERVIGVKVQVRVKKNKVGLPFRECKYPILFGYGVDDLTAGVEWLIEAGCSDRLEELEVSKTGYPVRIQNLRNKGGDEVRAFRAKMNAMVFSEWQRIEQAFLPQGSKY